ncbi:MAG TPA: hypothetical protein DCX32_02140 [Candidatus Moranbacteria bacterium]|nr:MAG: hypothetical protein UW87_C0007G0025 [Candidatus Moranbacteria bacterium GW2011_GWC2_45_10]KKT95497.1 MAG: hypothetical protein UW95_C0001G0061 [Parcubacteria group bacterium GW2011_GWC1_45_14]HAV11320.1 hypothetical protein [Candidatus Moranbacteria bacterium]
MNTFGYVALFNALVLFGLGLIVFFGAKKNRIHRILATIMFLIALWSLGFFFWQFSSSEAEAIVWINQMMFWPMFVPILFFRFILEFLGIFEKHKISWIIAISIATILGMGIIGGYLTEGAAGNNSFIDYAPLAGVLFVPYIAFFAVYLAYGSAFLVINHKSATPIRRQQIKYILWGSLGAYAMTTTNYFMWFGLDIPPFGNFALAASLLLVVYAIITKHLFDIRIVFRKSTVFVAALFFLVIFLLVAKYLSMTHLPSFGILADVTVLLVAVLVFPRLKKLFYKFSNKYFSTSFYDKAKLIGELTVKLSSTLDTRMVYGHIADALIGAMHSKAIGILFYNENNNTYYVQYNKGFELDHWIFPGNEELHRNYTRRSIPIIVEEIKKIEGMDRKMIVKMFEHYGVEIVVPMNIKDKNLGVIVLGGKESNDIYNDEDLKVLGTIAAQTALAIDNALKYEEARDFNKKLKVEVAHATEDLRKANEELKSLDKAKSEFIMIASHQLRTPLSIIKGFVDMILEGEYGKYNKRIGEVLSKIENANQRLSDLAEGLLDVSKMEAGGMSFDFSDSSLEEVLMEVNDNFSNMAKERNLALDFFFPEEKLPLVKMDRAKLREAFSSAIDNAIRYTREGSVSVRLSKEGEYARISVSDTGIGIKKEDLTKLFAKFSRGQGVSRIHTEGVGLGLYVARQIVEMHGGTISAQSEGEGKGSIFTIELPLKA